MTKEINDFNIEEESKMEGHVSLTSDFDFVTYDGPFKNVFGIKRILAVIIKETIDLYQYCSIDEIVDLIESVAEDVNSDARNHDIKFQTIVDKHGEELKEMVGFYSEVEEIIAREKAEGEVRGEARGEARGEILGAIKILFGFGYGEDEIISKISNEFNLTVEKADDYLNEYYERLKRSVSISN